MRSTLRAVGDRETRWGRVADVKCRCNRSRGERLRDISQCTHETGMINVHENEKENKNRKIERMTSKYLTSGGHSENLIYYR